MSDASEGRGRGWLPAVGLVLLPLLCCGLPLLIAAGALGVVGSVLGDPWVLGGAVVLAAGLAFWALRRGRPGTRGAGGDCCAPGEGRGAESASYRSARREP